jgi:serine/threonine protein kinase
VATDTEPHDDKPRGTTPVAFGKYRLHHRIARGGMGEVYRASLVGELGFEKPLVIKTILPELAAQPRFIEMFVAEAKTAVALSHGNIVPIYELGRAEDTFYIVMGYVDGPSVAELLAAHRRRGHPPPLAVALSIVRSVLSGLAYAHTAEPGRHAVVHRDITPRNVMVDRSGQVRIVDFGIASPASATVAVRAGSTGYVAPEQARAEAVDPRADVFSTACLLYELLTLERAFPNEGVWIAPDITCLPEATRTAIARALALDPRERPADASAFLSALVPALALIAAAVTGVWLWSSGSSSPRDLRAAGTEDARARTHDAPPLAPIDPTATRASEPLRSSEAEASSETDPLPSAGSTTLDSSEPEGTTSESMPPAALVLHVEPEGASVRIGTQRFEGSSPFVLPLPTHGVLEALVEHPGHQPQTVELRAGEPGERTLVLRPIATPVAPQGRGSLQVLAPSVSWAEVTVDGRRFGVTPTRKLELSAGAHRVVVRCVPDVCPEARILLRRTVEIEPGETLRLTAE